MRAVDLFSGWGGLTQGSEDAGVEVVWAANHWPLAVETHALNHPNTFHSCQDLHQADWTELPEYEILLAAPACQGHSTASQPKRRVYHDALRATALAVVHCAEVTRPKAIVVENVPAFQRWELFDWWVAGLRQLGYDIDVRQLVASRFGVPQRRKRLFIIGTHRGIKVPDLKPAATEPPFAPCIDWNAPEDVWRRVDDATPKIKERITRSRKRHGEVFLTQHTTDHMGVPLSEPIRTITTAPAHWNLVVGDRYRALTGRELARGMGFPDTYKWPTHATVEEVTQGIGNSVPPPLGKAVVAAVADVAA